jgi:hypothetical protein
MHCTPEAELTGNFWNRLMPAQAEEHRAVIAHPITIPPRSPRGRGGDGSNKGE